jgi:hypothetical protein
MPWVGPESPSGDLGFVCGSFRYPVAASPNGSQWTPMESSRGHRYQRPSLLRGDPSKGAVGFSSGDNLVPGVIEMPLSSICKFREAPRLECPENLSGDSAESSGGIPGPSVFAGPPGRTPILRASVPKQPGGGGAPLLRATSAKDASQIRSRDPRS